MDNVRVASELMKVAKLLTAWWGQRRIIPRENQLPTGVKTVVVDPQGTDLEIHIYELAGAPYAIVWAGKSNKKLWWVKFRDEAQRQHRIDETIASRKQHAEYKQKRQEERKQYRHTFKVDDILSSSWGYDQTNVDFYQVVAVTDKAVKIRKIGSKGVDESHVVAVPNSFDGPPMTKLVRQGDRVSLTSYSSASKWDGKPRYETPGYMGH